MIRILSSPQYDTLFHVSVIRILAPSKGMTCEAKSGEAMHPMLCTQARMAKQDHVTGSATTGASLIRQHSAYRQDWVNRMLAGLFVLA